MKNILIFTQGFYPGSKYGGPIRSITNLVKILNKENNIEVFTSDRDAFEDFSYDSIKVNSFNNNYENAKIYYYKKKHLMIKIIKKLFYNKKYDVVYLNSFFNIDFSAKILIFIYIGIIKTKKIILAPRGELTQNAISIKKIKKKIFLFIFKILKIHKKITFHFTSKEELVESLKFLGNVEYICVPNMHEPYPEYKQKLKLSGMLTLIYFSRITAKKNLITAIKSLSNIIEGKIDFFIAGLIDDNNYWKKCLKLISKLPKNIKCKYIGHVDHNEIWKILSKSHAFIFPTLSENYGHAIIESMVTSNIVLISNKTPWNEVKNNGSFVGNCYDDVYFTKIIKTILEMDNIEFNIHTKETYNYCITELKKNELLIKNMFE